MNSLDQNTEIRALADRAALTDLVTLWCRALDRGDLALLRKIFHDDAEIDCGTLYRGSIDGFLKGDREEMVAQRVGFKIGIHMVLNTLFAIDGDRAEGEIYSLAFEEWGEPHGQLQAIMGRYLDRYERRAGMWRISHRTILTDMKSHLPGLDQDRPDPLRALDLRGKFQDPADASFAFQLLAGLSK